MARHLRLDIVSDVVCPWCIIGYRQFEQALNGLAVPPELDLRWHPFQLNPDMPAEGEELGEHIERKYGSTAAERAQSREHMCSLGTALGIDFRFARGMRIHNTFKAHQLLHWAGLEGRQTELKLALFDAYFTRGENPDDAETLIAVAVRAGFDAAAATAALADEHFASAVRDSAAAWLRRGIQGVPAFVFDQRYLVSGAQGATTFTEILTRLQSDAAPTI